MFVKGSRYRTVPDTVAEDAAGRIVAAKELRRAPTVDGSFQHVVEQGERLDNLAFKYYRQPRKWWRISDANPDFLSPLELVGSGPVRTIRLPLSSAAAPNWAAAGEALSGAVGVVRFRFADDVRLVAQIQTLGGQPVRVYLERHDLAAVVTYNELVISRTALATLLSGTGFTVGRAAELGQIGRPITIPPNTAV